jgi:hypothetical protein
MKANEKLTDIPVPLERQQKIAALKVGDTVVRWLAATIPMDMVVVGVTESTILCDIPGKQIGPWTFSKRSGAELDPDLGWGEERTGSFIVP